MDDNRDKPIKLLKEEIEEKKKWNEMIEIGGIWGVIRKFSAVEMSMGKTLVRILNNREQ